MYTHNIINRAVNNNTVVPAFNIPYLPMMAPVIQAVADEDSVAMIQVARLEWVKFKSHSLEAIAWEYFKYCNAEHTLLHLDHIPVIDEDNLFVDVPPIIERAIKAGYQSVMIDGSRLPLEKNISATLEITGIAHSANIAVEAELGAVAGHEDTGIGISYEDLFNTRKGFTDVAEAALFVAKSKCDWLSVAVGNIHGSIAEKLRKQKKPEARLDIDHISALHSATNGIPLVLHGGSGIKQEYILAAINAGVAKINIGTEIRQPYEAALEERSGDIKYAQEKVYERTREIIRNFLHTSGNRAKLMLG